MVMPIEFFKGAQLDAVPAGDVTVNIQNSGVPKLGSKESLELIGLICGAVGIDAAQLAGGCDDALAYAFQAMGEMQKTSELRDAAKDSEEFGTW